MFPHRGCLTRLGMKVAKTYACGLDRGSEVNELEVVSEKNPI